MTILDQPAAHARQRVAAYKAILPLEEVRRQCEALPQGSFALDAALAKPGLSFICECKKASPSKGLIAPEFPYLARIRALAPGRPLWQAFRLHRPEDAAPANASSAEAILLDSGRGSGEVFDWALLAAIRRPYFLAGGLGPETVTAALNALHPYGVDVSSGIETDHKKDAAKMAAFVAAVRRGDALRGRALHLHLRRNRGGRADSARPAL